MRKPAELHGILAIDKPQGWTSHDVVARVRRLSGQRQVGHGGTLDPMATGLLPIGLGRGTRVLEYFSSGGKVYQATIAFGAATETYDADSDVTEQAPWQHITLSAVQNALRTFTGTIQQWPPMYSAIKLKGEALHRLARRGAQVEVPARTVTIHRFDVLELAPPLLSVEVECSGGTYIRSLAHDLGHALGSAAHLSALRRTRVGSLTLADAVTLDQLVALGEDGVRERLVHLDRPLWSVPAAVLSAAHAREVLHGRQYRMGASTATLCRAYDTGGRFLALLRYDADERCWRPRKVFADLPADGSNGVS